jgi:hypothetical protein
MSAEDIKLTLAVAGVVGVLVSLGVAANRGRDAPSAMAPFLWLAAFVVVGWALAVFRWT